MVKCIRCGGEIEAGNPCHKCSSMDQSLELVMRISAFRTALTRIASGDFEDAAHAIEIAQAAMLKDDAFRI